MCGIAGLIDRDGLSPDWQHEARALSHSIRHRGPDDHGYFSDAHSGEAPARFGALDSVRPRVVFIHRRLSILDLSEVARQPMVRDGVFISYNGEVYNFRELRRELESYGVDFRTTSDTEVVLQAYLRWGISCVAKFRGIFAFAIADSRKGTVFLARDHLGVKPLYYARDGSRWVFSSELKSFAALKSFTREPDPEALRAYLHFLWIPGEQTGLKGVAKLAPGSWLAIDLATGTSRTCRYWSPLDHVGDQHLSTDAAVEHVREELTRVVREQMVADVPLGAFLSGGLDSSLIVAHMKRVSSVSPITYSVGYAPQDLAYDIVPDDLPYAREVSALFEVRNNEQLLSPDVASLLPALVETLDEPVGDPAALSSYLICQAARKSLTVMLSGVGADEIFGGYPRQRALLYGAAYRTAPRLIRRAFGSLARAMPGSGRTRLAKMGRASQKFVMAAEQSPLEHYVAMESYFGEEQQQRLLARDGLLASARNPAVQYMTELFAQIRAVSSDPLRQSILWDLLTYLPNLNLAYTDRTSMAHGIEVRVPFLDIRLVEWSMKLHSHHLIRARRASLEGKWLLKRAASASLPAHIIWRKKAGFGAPVRSWLREDLAALREDLLGRAGLGARGWFDARELRRLQDDFLSGRADHALQIWMLMTLELWAKRFLDTARSAS